MTVPNLILIIVIVFGSSQSFEKNFWWVLGAGFLFEIFSVDFFGFNLFLFILTGILAWFLRNVFINKEKGIFLEIFFWLAIKLFWDLFNEIFLIAFSFFRKTEEIIWGFNFTKSHLLEIIIFILIGISIKKIWKIIENKFS